MKKSFCKILSFSILMVFMSSILFGCATTPQAATTAASQEKYKIAYISYQAVDSQEWLQNLVKGVTEYIKTHPNIEFKVIEALQTSDYEPKTRAAAEAGYNVIITSYNALAAATIAVAKDYPDIKFASLQGAIENISQYKNIEEFKLNRTQTGFLAGVVAGLMTKTNKVGIVGGGDSGGINQIIAGWQQGMRSVNPNIEDIVVYANNFGDPTKGKELGLSLVAKGADIIAAAAGGTGVGTAQAAAASNVSFVAWDVHYKDVLGKLELGSAVNFFDRMFIKFIEDVVNGKYKAGKLVEYGIADGVCDFEILDNSLANLQNIKDAIAAAKADLASGKIKVSETPLHK
jgi:basic membrane protein A and related proteins